MLGRLGTHNDLPEGMDVSSHMTAAQLLSHRRTRSSPESWTLTLGVNTRGTLIRVQQGVRARTSTAAIHKGKSVEAAQVPVSRSIWVNTRSVFAQWNVVQQTNE